VIRGYFERSGYERAMPRIRIVVSLPALCPNPVLVDFLIDTGATSTTLHPTDMQAGFGISAERLANPNAWDNLSEASGVGGKMRQFTCPAHYRLQRDDRTEMHLSRPVHIAILTDANRNLPSVLGWDILREFTMTLDARTGLALFRE
jgi:hypothetical protein